MKTRVGELKDDHREEIVRELYSDNLVREHTQGENGTWEVISHNRLKVYEPTFVTNLSNKIKKYLRGRST